MKVLLVRHAEAAAPAPGMRDRDRALTARGERQAKHTFRAAARLLGAPRVILCSEALRARQTADIFSSACAGVVVQPESMLNPGFRHKDLRSFLRRKAIRDLGYIAMVGHEPDLSEVISKAVARGTLRLNVRKSSCTLLTLDAEGRGTLEAVIPPLDSSGK